jgi:hypothetical protein
MSHEQGDTIQPAWLDPEGKVSIIIHGIPGFIRQYSGRRVISPQIVQGELDVLDNSGILSWTSGHALQQDNQQASPAPL